MLLRAMIAQDADRYIFGSTTASFTRVGEGVGEEFGGLREHESNGGNVSDILDR
jgi:hypothetical protein